MISFLLDTDVQIAMQKIADAIFAPSRDGDSSAADIDTASLTLAKIRGPSTTLGMTNGHLRLKFAASTRN
jgi:hypothetical protein